MGPELSAQKRLATFEAAALLFTAVTGLAMAVSVQFSPHGIRPAVDERAYVEWAQRIAHGQLVMDEPFYLDPLPAYVLAFLFWLTHGSLFAARLAYVALGVGTVALVGKIGRTLFSRREGALAMALLALYGPHTFTMGFVLKEALTVHLTAWALYFGLKVQGENVRPRTWAGFGLVCGLLVECRGNYVPLMPLLGSWVLVRAWRSSEQRVARQRQVALFCVGVALPLMLASAHNLAAANSWLPITVNGGANFWIGNNAQASGTYDTWEFSGGYPEAEKRDYKAEAERRAGHSMTLREVSTFWWGEAFRFWKEQPLSALALTAKKFWLLVNDYEIPDTYAFTCFRQWFTPVLWWVPLGMGSLLGLALVGGFLAVRFDRRAWFLAAFAVLYGSSVVAFLVFDRYRIPLCPVLCVFSAHALVQLIDRVRARKLTGLATPALVVAAATVLSFAPTSVSKEQEVRDAFCVGQAGLALYSDGLTDQAEVLFNVARAHDHGAPWIEVSMERVRALKALKER